MLVYELAVVLCAMVLFLLMLILQSPIFVFIVTSALLICCLVLKIKKRPFARIVLAASLTVSIIFIVFTRKDSKTSLGGALISGGIKFAFSHMIDVNEALFSAKEETEQWKKPESFSYDVVSLENSKIELLNGNKSKKAIYFIHGGAFINKLTNNYRKTASFLSEDLSEITVALIDYRTEGEAEFPASINDVVEGYRYLLDRGYEPKDIIVLGDSAGANLGLELIFSLKEMGEEIPSGIILLSPWADMTESGESYKYNAKLDPMFSKLESVNGGILPKDYFKGQSFSDLMVSPVFGDYSGFPRTLIQVGSYEILKSDSETIHEKCVQAGVDSTLTVYEGMFHVFQIICGKSIPESKQAWEEIEEFIKKSVEMEP